MFEHLLQLPLFQGMSPEALTALVEKYRFHFLKYHDGDTIVEVGETCTHIRFVVSGAARVVMRCRHQNVTISQTLVAPHVLGADSLFGLDTTYPFTAVSVGTCGILQIAKTDYVTMLQSNKVLLFNILNHLSRGAQMLTTSLLAMQHGDVAERLMRWVTALTTRSSQDVHIHFVQRDLCCLLAASRKTLIAAINHLEEAGLITHHQNEIQVLDLRSMRDTATSSVS